MLLDSESSEEESEEDEIRYADDSDDSLEESSEVAEMILPQEGLKWGQYYHDLKARDGTTGDHFVSSFFFTQREGATLKKRR